MTWPWAFVIVGSVWALAWLIVAVGRMGPPGGPRPSG